MEVVKWDKKSDINGVSAQYFFDNYPEFLSSDVFLVKNGNVVTRVESVETWKANLNLPNTSTEQVIQAFKDYVKAQEDAAQNEVSEIKKLNEKIDGLQWAIDLILTEVIPSIKQAKGVQ